MKVIFDVDGTLIRWTDGWEANQPVLDLLWALVFAGHEVHVASHGGFKYAQDCCLRLGISAAVTVVEKDENDVMLAQGYDLCLDDDPSVRFAPIVLRVEDGHEEREG